MDRYVGPTYIKYKAIFLGGINMTYNDSNDVIRHFRDEMRKIYDKRECFSQQEVEKAIKEAKTILRNLRKFDY